MKSWKLHCFSRWASSLNQNLPIDFP